MFLRRKQPGPLGWKIHKILTWIAIPSLNLAFEVVIIIYLCGNFYVSGCLGLEVTICWKSTVRKPTVDWKIVKNQAFDRFSRNLLYWKCCYYPIMLICDNFLLSICFGLKTTHFWKLRKSPKAHFIYKNCKNFICNLIRSQPAGFQPLILSFICANFLVSDYFGLDATEFEN